MDKIKKMDWAFIEKLVNLQEIEGLHAGNKFKKAHLNWRPTNEGDYSNTNTQLVLLMPQFYRNLKIKGFEDSETTTEFIRIIDRWFNILNSRNPHGCGYKAPIKMSNKHKWQTALEETIAYIKQLSWAGGQDLIIYHPKKTGFLGVIISSTNIFEVFNEVFVNNEHFNYLLTY